MTKRMSNKDLQRRKRNLKFTSQIYKEVCEELGYDKKYLSLQELYLRDYHHDPYYNGLTLKKIDAMRKAIDDLYCQKLRSLPTYRLEEILAIHNKGLIARTHLTIAAVIDELANRALMEDDTLTNSNSLHQGV